MIKILGQIQNHALLLFLIFVQADLSLLFASGPTAEEKNVKDIDINEQMQKTTTSLKHLNPEKLHKEQERLKKYQFHHAELLTRPKWELGMGFFSMRIPYYRGSRQSRTYLWPIPYFTYRGEKYQIENSGLSGNFYEGDRVTVGASISASLRVNSGKSEARSGMPNLDPTLEWGPIVSWDFWRDETKKNILSLNSPFRSVWAVEFVRARFIGTFFVPFVAWTAYPQKLTLGLFSEITLAVMYASRGYHDYFYSVPNEYSSPSRAAYRAHGGYSGAHATWYLSKKWPKFSVFGFVRYDQLKGVAFEATPLFQKRDAMVFGLGVISYFWQSPTMVTRKKLSPQGVGD